jgi:hypothetical protein
VSEREGGRETDGREREGGRVREREIERQWEGDIFERD